MTEEWKTKSYVVTFSPRFVTRNINKLKKKDKLWPINYLVAVWNKGIIDDSWENIYQVAVFKEEWWATIRWKEWIQEVFDFIKEKENFQIIDWHTAQILEEIKE